MSAATIFFSFRNFILLSSATREDNAKLTGMTTPEVLMTASTAAILAATPATATTTLGSLGPLPLVSLRVLQERNVVSTVGVEIYAPLDVWQRKDRE